MITYEEANRLLEYNAETGVLTWKVHQGRAFIGKPAGHSRSDGYLRLKTGGKMYLLHRLVWLLYTGSFPEGELDHINQIKTDNRIENLREVTRSENMKNTKSSKNTSGYRGVVWDKDRSKWTATVSKDSKRMHIGQFNTALEASIAYEEKSRELFPRINGGL